MLSLGVFFAPSGYKDNYNYRKNTQPAFVSFSIFLVSIILFIVNILQVCHIHEVHEFGERFYSSSCLQRQVSNERGNSEPTTHWNSKYKLSFLSLPVKFRSQNGTDLQAFFQIKRFCNIILLESALFLVNMSVF